MDLQRSGIVTTPYQRIKLQELEEHTDDNSRIPRTFHCETRNHLVSRVRVGDLVTIVGFIKTIQVDATKVSKGVIKDGGLHELYVVVNSLTKMHSQNAPENDFDVDLNGQNTEDISRQYKARLIRMRELAYNPFCFEILIASLCPSIFGNELVKAGLLLGLFGGTNQQTIGTTTRVRADIHVLIVGDPGLGKSQLLRAAGQVATRSVSVCGNTSTAAGLTVAISRDGKDTSLEAGALVLADNGVCCIDELDKLSCDYHSLLEAMEQQRISVAKGKLP